MRWDRALNDMTEFGFNGRTTLGFRLQGFGARWRGRPRGAGTSFPPVELANRIFPIRCAPIAVVAETAVLGIGPVPGRYGRDAHQRHLGNGGSSVHSGEGDRRLDGAFGLAPDRAQQPGAQR